LAAGEALDTQHKDTLIICATKLHCNVSIHWRKIFVNQLGVQYEFALQHLLWGKRSTVQDEPGHAGSNIIEVCSI